MVRRLAVSLLFLYALPAQADEIPNPLIDYDGFVRNVAEVAVLRNTHRVSEEEFIRMAKDPDTVILDARSAEKFRLLHVKGARNLSHCGSGATRDQFFARPPFAIVSVCMTHFHSMPSRTQVDVSFTSCTTSSFLPRGASFCFT